MERNYNAFFTTWTFQESEAIWNDEKVAERSIMAIGAVGINTTNKTQTYSAKQQNKKGGFLAGMTAEDAAMHENIANARQENAEDNISYPIGVDSYTEAEWDNFLEQFDATQDVIRQLMREKHQRMKQKQEEREEMRERELKKQLLEEELLEKQSMLVSKITTCTYPSLNPKIAIRYITWYTKEGIFCKKARETKEYEWAIYYEQEEQYDRVVRFIEQFGSEDDLTFAAREEFWMKFLNGEKEIEQLMKEYAILEK